MPAVVAAGPGLAKAGQPFRLAVETMSMSACRAAAGEDEQDRVEQQGESALSSYAV